MLQVTLLRIGKDFIIRRGLCISGLEYSGKLNSVCELISPYKHNL